MLVCEYNTLLQGSNQCRKTVGGIVKSWAVDWENVDMVDGNSETGIATNIILKSGKFLTAFEYDNDNTASYNQTTNRAGLDARIQQVATLKFTGANKDKTVIANKAKGVLNGLWIHLLNDGTKYLQGAEFNAEGDGIVRALVGAKVNPNVNSNTGESSSDVTWNIECTSTDIIPIDISDEDLDALVGEDIGDSDTGDSDTGAELPSVMILPLDGAFLTVVWNNGNDPSASRTLTASAPGYGSLNLSTIDGVIDLRCVPELFVGNVYALDINATITNSVGSDSDLIAGAIITGNGINGINRNPEITIHPPVSNVLQLPTISDGCCCGISSVDYILSGQILLSSYFPINLVSLLCGSYRSTDSIVLTVSATNNAGQNTLTQLQVATVTRDIDGYVTSVNGISC